jgi:hypothetical protein
VKAILMQVTICRDFTLATLFPCFLHLLVETLVWLEGKKMKNQKNGNKAPHDRIVLSRRNCPVHLDNADRSIEAAAQIAGKRISFTAAATWHVMTLGFPTDTSSPIRDDMCALRTP